MMDWKHREHSASAATTLAWLRADQAFNGTWDVVITTSTPAIAHKRGFPSRAAAQAWAEQRYAELLRAELARVEREET